MKMPARLAEYIQESIEDGREVLLTSSGDANVAIVLEAVTGEEWVIYCEWYYDSDKYTVCNIAGEAFKKLRKILNNGGKL